MNNQFEPMEEQSDSLEEEEQCTMCGGTGGWPGRTEWVTCKICNGGANSPAQRGVRDGHKGLH